MRKYKPSIAFPGSGENELPIAQALSAARVAKEAADAAPFSTGALLEAQEFTAGQTRRLGHGLGRRPVGWLVVYASLSHPELIATTSDATHITMVHGGAATTRCSIYFF